MNLLQRIWNQPTGRIALAIALSLMIHSLVLMGPNLITQPPVKPALPPLIAKLEPLPSAKRAPAHIKKHRPKPKPHKARKPATQSQTSSPVAPLAVEQPAMPSVVSQPEAAPGETQIATSASAPPEATTQQSEETGDIGAPSYPLPKQAELTFVAFLGTDVPVGTAHHQLEVDANNHYTLRVDMATTGFASLFTTFESNQQSSGSIGPGGLHPDIFSEDKVTSSGKQTLSARFDWQNKRIVFSSGNSSALPDQAQDMLSFLYQFSQMPLDRATLPMRVSNGRKLESYQLEVGAEQEIITRLGKLRTLHLTKIHAPGEEGLEIWLGLEYRLLPVKVRQIDRNGKIAGELVISEIRVSQE